jgi:C4-dicarboxylate-specific signal transduction histidine kinase
VNGLKNAVEAVHEVGADLRTHPIVVSWGVTDKDYWISIVDRGPGVAAVSATRFEVGKSTKPGHSGFGLAVARRAMESLGGELSLSAAEAGGARYELSWSKSS